MSDVVADNQTALLDLTGREFNQLWVDDNAPLFVANNPLHWKAHKLQVALARLDKIAEKNPAQFNSTVYMATLDKLGDLMTEINGGNNEPVLDAGNVAGFRDGSAAPEMGAGVAPSMDSGVSTDNPLSR